MSNVQVAIFLRMRTKQIFVIASLAYHASVGVKNAPKVNPRFVNNVSPPDLTSSALVSVGARTLTSD